MYQNQLRTIGVLGIITTLCACGAFSYKNDSGTAKPAASHSITPYAVPPSKYGNPETYQVFGREYLVLTSSEGYWQRGTASWYGPKFHGKRTSSGKTYDMHQMTAAHKTLPIPTFVQVSRLDTGQSIIVEVNDRGPFVDDRIIDLSYAAATQLDMVGAGTAPVEVKALPPYQYLARHATQPRMPMQLAQSRIAANDSAQIQPEFSNKPSSIGNQAVASHLPSSTQPVSYTVNSSGQEIPAVLPTSRAYLQVGAFSLKSRAEQLQSMLSQSLARPAVVESVSDELHRVKIGPLHDPQEITQLRLALAGLGIHNPYLVAQTDTQ